MNLRGGRVGKVPLKEAAVGLVYRDQRAIVGVVVHVGAETDPVLTTVNQEDIPRLSDLRPALAVGVITPQRVVVVTPQATCTRPGHIVGH